MKIIIKKHNLDGILEIRASATIDRKKYSVGRQISKALLKKLKMNRKWHISSLEMEMTNQLQDYIRLYYQALKPRSE